MVATGLAGKAADGVLALQPAPAAAVTVGGGSGSSINRRAAAEVSTAPLRKGAGGYHRFWRFWHSPVHSHKPTPTWVVAVGMELCGTLVNVAGKQCFRIAGKEKDKPRVSAAWYSFGLFLIIIVYGIFNNIAVQYAPNSVVSAVDGMIIVWNILLAPMTLGEAVTISRTIGALLITAGTFTASTVFGNHESKVYTMTDYLQLILSPEAIIYYIIGVGFVSLTMLATIWKYPSESRLGGAMMSALGGWLAGNGAIFEKVMWAHDAGRERLEPHYFMAGIYIITSAAGLGALVVAMRHHEALFCLPIYESALIVGAAAGGYAILREYAAEGNTPMRILGFWSSLGVLLLGLYLIVFWPKWLGDGDREICVWYRVCCGKAGRALRLLEDEEAKPKGDAEDPVPDSEAKTEESSLKIS